MSMNEDKPQVIDFEASAKVNEDQRKILMQLVEVMGVKELSARTDRLEQSVEQISNAMNQLIESNNKLVGMISNGPRTDMAGQATLPANQFDKIQAVGQLVETITNAWKSVKGQEAAPQAIFGLDMETINNEIRESAMGNFEIGKAIQNNLKSKLMQKTMSSVLRDAITHEPA